MKFSQLEMDVHRSAVPGLCRGFLLMALEPPGKVELHPIPNRRRATAGATHNLHALIFIANFNLRHVFCPGKHGLGVICDNSRFD